MFKIGEFSKLSQVPVKTLRYYDEIGLLKPAKVDRFTGYRYYSADQLPRLNRILALKDLGLSLAQIARLLNDDLPPAQIRGMLRLKQAELQQQVQEEQARLARVEWRLRQIERDVDVEAAVPVAGSVPAGARVTGRELPAVEEMACIVHQGGYDTIGEAYSRLMAWIEANGYRITGPNREVYVRGPEPGRDPATYVTEVQFPVGKA